MLEKGEEIGKNKNLLTFLGIKGDAEKGI